MSGAIDTITDEERQQLAQMQADDAASQPEFDAASAAASAPVPEAQEPEVAKEPPEQQTTVPQQALHAERLKRKAVEEKLARLEVESAAKEARVQERLNLLTQAAEGAFKQPTVAPEPLPDPNVDPMGYMQRVTHDLGAQIGTLREQLAKSEGVQRQVLEAQLQQAQIAELGTWGRGQEMQFAAQTPDYADAMKHLRETGIKELNARGITDPGQVDAMLQQHVIGMANDARQRGVNFGEMLYATAAARGYQKAAQQTAMSPTPQAPVATPAAQRVAAAQRGAEMAGGLGGAGVAPRGELTPDALASMDEAEFAQVLAKLGKGSMQQMFGV